MTKPMDHVAFLSQEIGPRPAGTEEEQQAALYVTEQLQKDAHLSAEIEDFICTSDAQLPRIICLAVALVAGVLGLVVPVLGIPAVIFAVLAGGVYTLETLGRPVLSQAFMKGVSQNVVAKYEPVRDAEGTGARRRKVIVVANYDSGHVRRDLAGPFVSLRRPMQYAVIASALLLPIMLLLRTVFSQTPAAGVLTVLAVLLLVLIALPLAFLLVERYAPYNEAANSNASGVAVMLEVARRLGNGEVRSDSEAPVGAIHGEAAAYAAGVVPEGASLSYEMGAEGGGLNAAKAAIAAMTGVAPKEYEVQDVASNLVQVKDETLGLPDEAELARMRQETKEALANLPAGTLAEAAARAALLEKEAEYQARLDALRLEEEARASQEEEAAAAVAATEEAVPEEQFAYRSVLEEASNVPDWYKKATEKAHAHAARESVAEASYRSRYADFPPRETEEDASVKDIIEQMYLTQDDPASAESEQDAQAAGESGAASSDAAVVEIEGDAAPYAVFDEEEAAEESHAARGLFAQVAHAGEYSGEQSDAKTELSPAEDAAAEAGAADAVEVSDAAEASGTETAAVEEALLAIGDDAAASGAAKTEGATEKVELAAVDAVSDAVEGEDSGATIAFGPVPNATTALPAVAQGGNLDLGALRAAAEGAAPAAQQAEGETAREEELPAAETTRLPNLMYYTPPTDRSDVMEARGRKDRVMVNATGAEVQDMAASDASDAADAAERRQVGLALQIPALEPQVASAGIPVVDLPQITLPHAADFDPKPISLDDLRQRAPLASVESNGQQAAKSLLATTLPSIDAESPAEDAPAGTASDFATGSVSATSSFAAISAVGGEPVGDELLADVDPEDIYVEDADDSVFEEEFTETGAFAGPGYVEMPQSRMGKFFGRFRRKKDKQEESAAEWLGVDDDFDARSAGKARGGWESFREEDEWEGGGFSTVRARFGRNGGEAPAAAPETEPAEPVAAPEEVSASAVANHAVSRDAFAEVARAAAAYGDAHAIEAEVNEMHSIYSFAAGDVNTEVWFVALGSELAGNNGIKAFLAEHASDMRGAIIVNLEAVGSGNLSYLMREGHLSQASCSARMKRFVKKASQASGVDVAPAELSWRESPASYAVKHRMQAMTLAGMENGKPIGFGQADDVIENINPESLDQAADFVVELLKNI